MLCSQRLPTISVDTKKKELIGNFKNPGRTWKQAPIKVYDHDFPSDAQGKMIPYGIYDPQANHAFVNVGSRARPRPWRSIPSSSGGSSTVTGAMPTPPSC